MFTWICPKCGTEVPPSSSECPRCAAAAAAPPPAQPQAPPPLQFEPPPPQSQPPPQTSQRYVIAEPRRGMPGWLVMLLVAAVLGGGFYGIYRYTSHEPSAAAPVSQLEAAAARTGNDGHPYAKSIELTGLRLYEDTRKRVVLRYVVVNHSMAPMPGVELNIRLSTTSAAGGEPPIAVIPAKVGNLDPHGVKEMEALIETRLRVYELPDWQFLKTSFDVTAPAQ